MPKAVFFDRDGVLNKLILNPSTNEFESPHRVEDLELTENIIYFLKKIKLMGFLIFLISNQPSFAKGKTSLENIKAIHNKLDKTLRKEKVIFSDYFYCYHQESDGCVCRKPSPYFLKQAIEEYGIDVDKSWMVGDQDTDIQCGQSAGLKTILIETKESEKKRGKSSPDATVQNFAMAIRLIGEHQ